MRSLLSQSSPYLEYWCSLCLVGVLLSFSVRLGKSDVAGIDWSHDQDVVQKVAAGNTGWRLQFRCLGLRHPPRVPELWMFGGVSHRMTRHALPIKRVAVAICGLAFMETNETTEQPAALCAVTKPAHLAIPFRSRKSFTFST